MTTTRCRLGLAATLFMSVANVATAQEIPPRLSMAQAQQDLSVVRKALEEAHGALYRFTPKPELDRTFDAIRARANREMTRREFVDLVNELLVATGDGHARVDLDDSTTAELDRTPRFPLQVVLEGTRLMVTSNDTRDDTIIRPGMEIISVNGHTVPELLARIMPTIRRDGFVETGRRVTFGSAFALRYWITVDTSSRFVITARAGKGAPVSATLPGVLTAQRTSNSDDHRTTCRRFAGLRTCDRRESHCADQPIHLRDRVAIRSGGIEGEQPAVSKSPGCADDIGSGKRGWTRGHLSRTEAFDATAHARPRLDTTGIVLAARGECLARPSHGGE